ILEVGIEHALHRLLQPARHGDVVGVDAPVAVRHLALDIEHMPRAGRAEQDAPEAGVGRIGIAVLIAHAQERVLSGQNQLMRIGNAHLHLPLLKSGGRRLSAYADLRGSSFLSLAPAGWPEPRGPSGVPVGCRQSPPGRASMGTSFRRGTVTFVARFVGATLAATLAWSSLAQAQSEPPGRV